MLSKKAQEKNQESSIFET